MHLTLGLVPLALSVRSAFAVVPNWAQCGGNGYTGDTVCVSGATCTMVNQWYHQCTPGGTPTITNPPVITPSPTSTISTTSTTPTTSFPSIPVPSTGFVTINGTAFSLDGQPFTVVGSNSYWVGLSGMGTNDMNTAFRDIARTGATTVRTWGFNEVVNTSNPIYYQRWSGSTPTVNTGSNGLQNFDSVIAAAKANGIRLIVALTNNWSDFGGMDVYVNQIAGQGRPHDLFYTDEIIKTAFKNYIRTFVGRYMNEQGILAWELANEPRCRGSTGTTSGNCTPATITAWAHEISKYIKSIDRNHLVALGDEGFYNQPGNPSYPYQGSEGIDFDANLAISTLDFGTVHAYPDHWGQSSNGLAWGKQWITDHAASQKKAGKPVILEEFGVENNQVAVYTEWLNTIVSGGLAGDLIWQAGSRLPGGPTHDDGYTIYPDDPVYPVLTSHAAALKARGPPTSTPPPPIPTLASFITVNGTRFSLNGKPYTVVGHNSYWVGLSGLSTADMNIAFQDIARTGATTVRTWGFNEVTSPQNIYYQLWSGSTPTVNTGSTGLQNFDNVISVAKANGLRLIVALTNNWSDYGGMDVYVNQILGQGQPHDYFYTNKAVKDAFKNYIRTFVGRYINEPAILGWELANEPRCRGSTTATSGGCTPAVITAWAREISAFIKSIDSNHLVALGDEGFYNQPGHPSYPYQGGEGIDFDANLQIATLDFGTVHAYPDHWGQSSNAEAWGVQWINDHAASQNRVGKPVILEEFGVDNNQATTYTAWLSTIVSSGLAGDLIWQAGSRVSWGLTHDDGYTIYPDDPVYPILTSHNAATKARG